MSLTIDELHEEMDELSSAEDFLDHFGIDFDAKVVQINRLHILQRFHDYLDRNPMAEGQEPFGHYGSWLEQAYLDFVDSSAQEQKVLRVFKRPQPGFVSLDDFS